MLTRLLSTGLSLVFFTTLLPTSALAADASDPNAILTRGELLQTLLDSRPESRLRVENIRIRLSKQPLFADVSRDDWVAPYAEVAFMTRVTSGFPDRTLRPTETIPVEEAITLMMRAYRQPTIRMETDRAWYAPYVRGALAKNLVANPWSVVVGQPVTRGQFNGMLYRLSVVERDGLAAYNEPARVIVVQPGQAVTAGAVQQPESQPQPPAGGPVLVANPTSDPADQQYASSQGFAITIPSLGITDLRISHPEDPQSKQGLLVPLQSGVGHLFSYPGKGGKIMIYGHSSGYAWDVSQYTKIFRQVNKLKEGDKVYVTYNGRLFAYSVTGQETVTPDDRAPFRGSGEELLLYTCWPPNSIKKRLIVRAVPVETVAMR